MEKELEPVYRFVLEELGISSDSQIEREYPIRIGERELRIDLAIKSKNTLTLIEIKPTINEDAIYRIFALSHLLDNKMTGGRQLQLVCVGKTLKYSTKDVAERLGVRMVLIPPKLYNYLTPAMALSDENARFGRFKAGPPKLAAEKAWKIICYLLNDRPASILAVSKKTGISYGWTNNIIHKLEDFGIINADYGLRIKDIDKLLNVVSWERPLESLLVETINTNFSTAAQCINEVALNLNRLGIDYAFTAHSSAVSYGSTIVREDTAYIYLPELSSREAIRSFSERNTKGCRLKVYAPDRNIMKFSTIFNGIRIVDVCQNILDLAGLGIDGRIAAKDLVYKSGK